jgi:aarF domain-containing kinase
MVAEWIDGVKISDTHALQRMGFRLRDVITTATEITGEQVFVSGHVHCDPHPGNMFVRPHPSDPKRFQVVLLDHGLYVHESEAFRRNYADMWCAIVLGDMARLKEICTNWGVGDPELFASFQLLKPYDARNKDAIHMHRTTQADVLNMQMRTKERIRSLLQDSAKIPKELTLVGRAMNLVRANNKGAGSPVNRIHILSLSAARGMGHTHAHSTADVSPPPGVHHCGVCSCAPVAVDSRIHARGTVPHQPCTCWARLQHYTECVSDTVASA